MELDALKSEWKNFESDPKQREQLQKMTGKGSFKFITHIKRRLMIESTALFFLLFVYLDWFDGHLKPLWVNVLLGCSLALFIGHDLIVYRSINLHLRGCNLKNSLHQLLADLKFKAITAIGLIALFYASITTFFIINIAFNASKWMILGVLILFFAGGLWLNVRWWQKRISSLKKCMTELEEQ